MRSRLRSSTEWSSTETLFQIGTRKGRQKECWGRVKKRIRERTIKERRGEGRKEKRGK